MKSARILNANSVKLNSFIHSFSLILAVNILAMLCFASPADIGFLINERSYVHL